MIFIEAMDCPICHEALEQPSVACAKGHALHRACYLRWKETRRLRSVPCVLRCGSDYLDTPPGYSLAATISEVPRGAWTVLVLGGRIYYR